MKKEHTFRVYKDAFNHTRAEILKPGTPDPEHVLRVYAPVGDIMCVFLMTNMSHEEAVRLGQLPEDLQAAVIEETNRAGLRDNHETYYMLAFQLHPLDAKKYERRIAHQLDTALTAVNGRLNPHILRIGNAYRYDLVVNEKRLDETREAIAAILKKCGIKEFKFEPNTF